MLLWMVYVCVVTLILTGAAQCGAAALRLARWPARWVWLATLLCSLVVPATIASVSIEVPQISSGAPGPIIALRDMTSLPVTALARARMPAPGSRAGVNLDTAMTRLWLAASSGLLCLLLAAALQLHLRARRWHAEVVAGVAVYIADDAGPAVVGLLHQRIVLPPWVAEASAEQQTLVLAHERAHLSARDPLLLTVALGLLVFMPWNLPLWWHLRQLRRAIEVDCDARVLSAGHDVRRYGETLLEVGARQSGMVGTVAAMAEFKPFLEQRLHIMLRTPGRWWKLSASVLAGCCACLVAVAAQVGPPPSGTTPSEAVAVDPAVYEGYVGTYKLTEGIVATVAYAKPHLTMRLTGQTAVEFFPSSPTEFFTRSLPVQARITFTTDGQGHATALTLHQGGQNLKAPRMDEAAAQAIEGALQARVQGQTPQPGSEAAVRAHFASLLAGTPNYADLSPGLAAAAHQQQPQLEALARQLGPIQSVQFRGVGSGGEDVYEVTHEHGVSTWRITMAPDGKVAGILVRPGV